VQGRGPEWLVQLLLVLCALAVAGLPLMNINKFIALLTSRSPDSLRWQAPVTGLATLMDADAFWSGEKICGRQGAEL